MNEGGKVVYATRNGWVQQTATPNPANPNSGTGLTSYSGYTWWQDPVYGFDYPPGQAGDDDRPHTAFLRELDISNDWSQWWLGVGGRQGGVGTTTLNTAAVEPSSLGGILAGMPAFALDTDRAPAARSSRRRTPRPGRPSRARRRRSGCARCRASRRSGRSARSAWRPTTPARRRRTAARSSRRATPWRSASGSSRSPTGRPARSSSGA